MLHGRRLLVALGLVAVSIVVIAVSDVLGPEHPRRLPFADVTKSYPDLHYPKRALYVFRSRSELDQHLAERTGKQGAQLGRPRLPRIDFGHQMLIVVAMGARSSTGYALKLRGIEREGNTTLVRVREISPTTSQIVAPAITYPYLALAVPKQDGRTQLRLSGEE